MSRVGVNASEQAGIMTHCIADVAGQYSGNMSCAKTDWGAETHHRDYERYVHSADNYIYLLRKMCGVAD